MFDNCNIPAPGPCQLAKTITRHRVKIKYTRILGFLVPFVTASVFAKGGLDGGDSLVTMMVKEMATAPVLYPEMSGPSNYPSEATLIDLATEGASTRLTRSRGSTDSGDLQPLVNTTWQFTYTVDTNTYTATISCSSFVLTLSDGTASLTCITVPQNEVATAIYVPMTGDHGILVNNTLQDAFRFKLQGCCSASGSYYIYSKDTELQHPYPLTGTRTNPPATTDTGTNPSVSSRDFDGDGKDDILWYNKATGDLFLYTSSQGDYPFGNVPVDLGWMPLGVFDYDKDGRADILWWNRKNGGEVYVWLGNGNKSSLGFVSDTNWKPCCGGDLDGDGFGDILWNNQTTGELYVWYSDKNQTKVPYGGVDSKSGWLPKGVADFDGDSRGDILWWNQNTGDLFFWTTTLGNYPHPGVPVDTGWMAVGAGNFDGYKKPDLLWWNQNTGEVYIRHDGGKGPRTSRGKVPDLNWSPM